MKNRFSTLFIGIICLTLLTSFISDSGMEIVIETSEDVNIENSMEQRKAWLEEFHKEVRIQSTKLLMHIEFMQGSFDLENQEKSLAFDTIYFYIWGNCAGSYAVGNEGDLHRICTSWGVSFKSSYSGMCHSCSEGGGGTDCGEDGGPCETGF